jgi:hypothetical protein
VSHRERHDVTNRISLRLSHVCETDRPFPLAPTANANLSTHCIMSCANRSAVAFASTMIYVTVKLQYCISTMSVKITYSSQFDEMGQGFHKTMDRDRAIRNML